MTMQTRTAACSCGKLRAVCKGEPERVGLCCCTACQRRTGSAYGANAYFLRHRVRIEGTSKPFLRSSDAGRKVEFHFCPECGSTVHWDLEAWPDLIGVAVGAFASTGFPAPGTAVWTENKCPWVPLPQGILARPQQI